MDGGMDAQVHGLMPVCTGAQCPDGQTRVCGQMHECTMHGWMHRQHPARARQSRGIPVAFPKWRGEAVTPRDARELGPGALTC